MLKKIISGGQTGADRAALDVAIKYNIPHGGWVPKGRLTEDGALPLIYNLTEMPTTDYKQRTRQNIIDSQGTAIISRGTLKGGSLLTQTFARVKGKPNCHIDLTGNEAFEASVILHSFILENNIKILNVAGPRLSHDPGIYFDVKTILEAVVYLSFLDSDQDLQIWLPDFSIREDFPRTVKEAVLLVAEDLPLKTKIYIARLDDSKILDLYFTWLDYLRKRVGFDSNNKPLLQNCAWQDNWFTIEDGVMEIVKALKNFLGQEYRLKVLK